VDGWINAIEMLRCKCEANEGDAMEVSAKALKRSKPQVDISVD
jgi:hypothetical protein